MERLAFSHPKHGPEPPKCRKNNFEMKLAESQGRIFKLKRVQIEFNEGRVSHFALKHSAI